MMKTLRNHLILLVTVLIGFTQTIHATDIDRLIADEMRDQKIIGLAASIVKNDQPIWSKGYGLARKSTNTPVDEETIFLIASISKTVTGVALMKLYEGGLDLDDDISNYMPFNVVHPRYPNTPITFRMLLTHTSGISDEGYDELDLYTYGSDSPIALGTFIERYLKPGGKYYSKRKNFGDKPGTNYDYSNVGVALIGYLVERISHVPFDVYCNNEIFAPLDMTSTSWFLKDLPKERLAMPYDRRGKPYGQYTFPDYPDGQLRTTIVDLSRFLKMFMQDGTLDSVQILRPETVDLMRRVAFPELDRNQGLIWYYLKLDGKRLCGHEGDESGVTTTMFFNPKTDVGGIVLTNGDNANLDRIISALIKKGEESP